MDTNETLNYILTQAEDLRRAESEPAKEMYEARIKVAVKKLQEVL